MSPTAVAVASTDMSDERASADAADAAAALRARRRAAVRRHHPDHGGDLDTFLRVMADLDREAALLATPGAGSAAPLQVVVTGAGPVRRAGRTVARAGREAVEVVRTRLPRGVPGARRYGRL